MTEEPLPYPNDEITKRLDELSAEIRARHTAFLSKGMRKLQAILANVLDVEPQKVTRRHMVRFLRNTPDKEILRWRGISAITMRQLREEIANEPET
jgi:hypothetical protein